MTGSALSKYLQVQAARNVSCGKKEMILRRIGGGSGRGMGSGFTSGGASADLYYKILVFPLVFIAFSRL